MKKKAKTIDSWQLFQMVAAVLVVGIIGYYGFTVSGSKAAIDDAFSEENVSLSQEEENIVDEYLNQLWLAEVGYEYAQELTDIDLAYIEEVKLIMTREATEQIDATVLTQATQTEAREFFEKVLGTTGYRLAEDAVMADAGFTTDTEMIAELVQALSLNSPSNALGALLQEAQKYEDNDFDSQTFSQQEAAAIIQQAANLASTQDFPEILDEVSAWLNEVAQTQSKSWWQKVLDWIINLFRRSDQKQTDNLPMPLAFLRAIPTAHAQFVTGIMLPIVGHIQQGLVGYLQSNPSSSSPAPAGVNWTWDKPEALNNEARDLYAELEWLNERLKLNQEALAKAEAEGDSVTAAIHRRAITLIEKKLLVVLQKINGLQRAMKDISDAKARKDEKAREAAAKASKKARRSQTGARTAYALARARLNAKPSITEWLEEFRKHVGRGDFPPLPRLPQPEPLPVEPLPPGYENRIPGLDLPSPAIPRLGGSTQPPRNAPTNPLEPVTPIVPAPASLSAPLLPGGDDPLPL